jgi:predicted ATPase
MKRPQVKASAPFLRRITIQSEKADPTRHPFNVEALRGLDLEFRSSVTFFVGENGSGKSTLLEAVAQCCGFNVQGGGRDHQAQTGDNRDDLASALRLSWLPKATDGFFMRAESFFNFASYIDQVSTLQRYGGRRLHEQSHGESFLALFVNRFGRGIYILDEPEAALSPQRQLAFLKVIHDLEATGQAQFLIASHSPILLAYPKATLLSLDGGPIHEVAYADTEHYKLTKEFLDSPERFFKHLFENSNDEDDDAGA